MPETAVNEDHLPAGGEDQIGFAGEFRAVKAVAVAHGVSKAADPEFSLAALRLDARHPLASLLLGQGVQSVSRGPSW